MRRPSTGWILCSLAVPSACSSATEPQSPPVNGAGAESAPADVLEEVLARAVRVVKVEPAWASPPEQTDETRWPYFVQRNRSHWELELDRSRVPPSTVYARIDGTEEGGSVAEYLVFDADAVTWWFDGRNDFASEFKDPAVRRERVSDLHRVVFDGKSAWRDLEDPASMPLDGGIAIGIRLESGAWRYW